MASREFYWRATLTGIHFYLQVRMASIHFYSRATMASIHFYSRATLASIHFHLRATMTAIHFYLRVPMTTMHFYLRVPMTTIDSICYSFIHPHDRSPLRTCSKHLCICLLVSPVGDLSLPSSLVRWTVFYHRIRTNTASHDSSAKKQCC